MEDARYEPRKPRSGHYSLTWQGPHSTAYSTEGSGVDLSDSGVGLECPTELKTGSIVYVQARDGALSGYYEVIHCSPRRGKFHIGLEHREETPESTKPAPEVSTEVPNGAEPDHYETLQISSNADIQTIHRVFRIMAARFHPDNPETGDVEQFIRMKRAYTVLSDPALRSQYDVTLKQERDDGPRPIFASKDFVTGVEAESNRRLGVMCLLYTKRQTDPDKPGISLLELEKEMGFPREYLAFTTWYLRAKDFITVADNSDYALTAAGADFVEEKAIRHEIVSKMLNPGFHFDRGPKPPTRPQPRRKLLA